MNKDAYIFLYLYISTQERISLSMKEIVYLYFCIYQLKKNTAKYEQSIYAL